MRTGMRPYDDPSASLSMRSALRLAALLDTVDGKVVASVPLLRRCIIPHSGALWLSGGIASNMQFAWRA